ncbi:MAG TPA: hypothetical protein VMH04_00975 [Candidatus Solibacter sp.]|nr:hypothetical protein [Candidatus Solibacter sp.]
MTYQAPANQEVPQTRRTTSLNSRLDQSLNAYFAAAGAAGVGLLLAVQPAAASVVYTKTNIVVGVGEFANIDLNGDGVTDIYFSAGGGSHEAFLSAVLPAGNGVFNSGKPQFFGVPIGRGEHFKTYRAEMAVFDFCSFCTSGSGSGGPWAGKKNRYMGLKFQISGQTHFGWLRITVKNFTATITGYAYETVPQGTIKTGYVHGPSETGESTASVAPIQQPASLGLLARGADGLYAWRREQGLTLTV